MQDFQMSSNREGSYCKTFSDNNSNRQKEIEQKPTDGCSINYSTSRFDMTSQLEENENIKYKILINNIKLDSNDCKQQGRYNILQVSRKDDTFPQINYQKNLVQTMNNQKVNSQSQIDSYQNNLTNFTQNNTVEQDSSSFLNQSISSQFHNIGMSQSKNILINSSQMSKKVQKKQQLEMIKGDFSLFQYYDTAQDDIYQDNDENPNQFEDSYNKKQEQNISQQNNLNNQERDINHNHLSTHNTLDTIQSQSCKQQQLQNQLSHNQILDDSNCNKDIINNKKTFIQKQNCLQINKKSDNFKVFKQKQTASARINNFLTSEESNPSNQIDSLSLRYKSNSNLMRSNDDFEQNNYPGKQNTNALNDQMSISSSSNGQKQDKDEINNQENDQNIQFITLQNDLDDSTQNNIFLKKYFDINSTQKIETDNNKNENILNNQSAHFKTMNPEHLEQYKTQQINQINLQNSHKGIDEHQIQKINNMISQEYEFTINNNLSINSLKKNIMKDNQIQDYCNFDDTTYNGYINNNQEYLKNKYSQTKGVYENNYKFINLNGQNIYQNYQQNQNDYEIMQKMYKTNQELALQNKKLNQNNESLQKELEIMKSDLMKKYQDIRNNNENIFQNFEEQSNLMLKKQKEKYEEKILQLQSQLRDSETQNIYKKDNFRDRNNQLYAMVLKLEKEKQELHDKNLQLIKQQINSKNKQHINTINQTENNATFDSIQENLNQKQITNQYQHLKNKQNEQKYQLNNINDQNTFLTNQSSFYQGIISPISSSSSQNKSKSIDGVKMSFHQSSDYNKQDKNQGNTITQVEKTNDERKYNELLTNYKKIVDENNQLKRKNQSINNIKNIDIDRSIFQSSILSPSQTTFDTQTNNYLSSYTNNDSTQCNSSYYQPSIYQKDISVKPYHKKYSSHIPYYDINQNKSIDNSILSCDKTNQLSQSFVNKCKKVTYAHIPSQKHFKTEESNYSPINANKKNITNHKQINSKCFVNHDDKENKITNQNRDISIDELNYQNQSKFTRIKGNILRKKYIDKEVENKKDKKRSISKQKDFKKKKPYQNISCLDINVSRDKIKKINDEQNENICLKFKNNYIQNMLQQNKPKKIRSSSVSKSTIVTTKSTINNDKDTSYYENINKRNKNKRKQESKRSSSNIKGTKVSVNNKINS